MSAASLNSKMRNKLLYNRIINNANKSAKNIPLKARPTEEHQELKDTRGKNMYGYIDPTKALNDMLVSDNK